MGLSSHSRRRFRDIAALVDLTEDESEVTATTSLVQRTARTSFPIDDIAEANGPSRNRSSSRGFSFSDQLKSQKQYIQHQQSIEEEEEEDDDDESNDDYEDNGSRPHLSAHLLQQHYSQEEASSSDSTTSSGSNSFEVSSNVFSSTDLSMEAEAEFWGGSTAHRFTKSNFMRMQQLEEEEEEEVPPPTASFTSRFQDRLRSRFSPQKTKELHSSTAAAAASHPGSLRDLVLNATDSTDSCTTATRTISSHTSGSPSNEPTSMDDQSNSIMESSDHLPTSPQHVEDENVPSWKLEQRLKMRQRMGLLETPEEVSTPRRSSVLKPESANLVTPPEPSNPESPIDSPPPLGRTRNWRTKEFRRTFEHKKLQQRANNWVDEDGECTDEDDVLVPATSSEDEESCEEYGDTSETESQHGRVSMPQSPLKKLRDLFETFTDTEEGNSVASKSYMDDPSLHEQRRKNSKILDVRGSLTKATPIDEDSDDDESGVDDAENDSAEGSMVAASAAVVSSVVEEEPLLPPPATWWTEMEEKVERYHRAVRNKSAAASPGFYNDLRLSFEGFAETQNQLGRAMAVALFQGIQSGQEDLREEHDMEIESLKEQHERELAELKARLTVQKSPGSNTAQRNEAFRQKWKSRMNSNHHAANRNTDGASTVVSNMSCRELSVQRYRERILRQMNKERNTVSSHNDGASDISSTPTTNSEKQNKENAQEIQRLLDELQQAERRQKLLEKQLNQAGVVLAEDIPYQVAKDKVASISKRMNEIGSSGVVHQDALVQKQLREEYFRLEKDMQKYLSALMLTDEFAQEQRAAAEEWEAKHARANRAALEAIRKHMPLDIRTLSAQQLEEDRGLPKPMVQKFRRTNVLQLLRVDPAVVCKWHPSTLEAFRVTGLTLTERRAIHSYLLPVAKTWRGSTEGLTARADPMTTRKLQWYDTMRTNFKEALERYERHLGGTNGTPKRHIHSTCLCNRCDLIGNQCPVRANKAMDYFATDLGFPYQEGDKLYEDAKIVVGGTNEVEQKSPAQIIAEARGQNREDCIYEAASSPKPTPIRKPITPKPAKNKSPSPTKNNRPRHPLMSSSSKGPAKPSGLLAAIAARRID